MRSHTASFSASSMKTQLLTSMALRPQPWQISSNKVEQMPMHGLSGRSNRLSSPRGEFGCDSGCDSGCPSVSWADWLGSCGFDGMRLGGGADGRSL